EKSPFAQITLYFPGNFFSIAFRTFIIAIFGSFSDILEQDEGGGHMDGKDGGQGIGGGQICGGHIIGGGQCGRNEWQGLQHPQPITVCSSLRSTTITSQ
uniref:Uncharacterized protein n=1 Tax=Parascaris equorum TaxID=6256 RepID=A0A914RHT6_PAREQ